VKGRSQQLRSFARESVDRRELLVSDGETDCPRMGDPDKVRIVRKTERTKTRASKEKEGEGS
jgi:hypothetical protein